MIQEISIDIPIIKSSVCASVFGVAESNPDNYDSLCKAIQYCRENHINRLVIPTGQYRFATAKPICMEYLDDFMLDGQGSEFVFTQVVNYVTIKNCNRFVLKDLKIDWDWEVARLATLGRIRNIQQGVSFEIEFYEVDWLDEHLPMDIMNAFDPVTLTPGREGGREFGLKFLTFQREGDNLFRFFTEGNAEYDALQEGEVQLIRHYKYEAEGFIILDTTHISFENVTIFSVPGFAYGFDGDCHHIRLKGCKIMLKPNTNRRVTATADGFHIRQSQGYVIVEDCDFSFMGDDAINIHDNNGVILEKLSSNCLHVKNISKHAHYHIGDLIEFRHRDLSPTNVFATIVDIRDETRDEIILTFDLEVPDDGIVFNKRYDSSNYIFRNNYFHENRARGILVHSNKGMIVNNRFYKNQGAAIQIETGIRYRGWSEGTGVDQLLVQNNVFDTCDVNDWNHGVIYISTYLPEGRTQYPIFKNIQFLHNHFINVPNRALIVSSAENITISNNTFSNPDTRIMNHEKRNTIWIEKSTHITIEDNTIEASPYIHEQFVEIEEESTRNIIIRNTQS